MQDKRDLIPKLGTRSAYFDFLEGRSVESLEGLHEKHSLRSLVKSYMLETVRDNCQSPSLSDIFSEVGLSLTPLSNETLSEIRSEKLGGIVGLLERITDRHPVIYTVMEAGKSDAWIRNLVASTPWLDQLWLSSPILKYLWSYVKRTTSHRRYTRLGFDFTDAFEAESDETLKDLPKSAVRARREIEQDSKKASRFTLVDRISEVDSVFPEMARVYSPFNSLTQLRIPSVSHGGHDFYFDGKVTNRSDSFLDHRQNIELVINSYSRMTEQIEDVLWLHSDVGTDRDGLRFRGAPAYFEFSEPIEQSTFDSWVDSTFGRRGNRFRLNGEPIRLGTGKVHVYGVDGHLWQPIALEITRRHAYALLPQGTCGNTVHRLATNIQRLVDPRVSIWLGGTQYSDLIAQDLNSKVS